MGEGVKQTSTLVVAAHWSAQPGSVVVVFGYDKEEDYGAWAYTRVCLGMAVVRQHEAIRPNGDGFDVVGKRLDWADSLVPIYDGDWDQESEIGAQKLVATSQTTTGEILNKLHLYASECECAEEKVPLIFERILEALRRVGIFPQ